MSNIGYDENFENYIEMIVAHPNYEGLFYERNENGKINWVVTGKSENGRKRQSWWNKKCIDNNIPIQNGCYAKIARLIHPTGKHVCQCCGKEKSIFYEYPNKNTTKKINKILGTHINPESDEERVEHTIREIIEANCNSIEKAKLIAEAFGLPSPSSVEELIESIYKELVDKESKMFSPGVMSNSPDRFDGFHSYGLCCRTAKDTGRHQNNMDTYAQDRRAYEDWSDGNYNLANRIMGEFRKQPPMKCPKCGYIKRMSADHIGPISLGFCHSTHFAPICSSCNSSKNNRLSKSDIDKLIKLENNGEQVISWHSKYIWDMLKNKISNNKDAKKASSIMAKCHQNILNILAIIHKETGDEFLMRYLHPEYSMMDYRFENFDLNNLDGITIIETPIDNKNKRNNQERYIRIAFESLDDFLAKQNRKNYFLIDKSSDELSPIISAIREKDFNTADFELKKLIEKISKKIFLSETEQKITWRIFPT